MAVFTIKQALEFAVKTENEGAEFYAQAAKVCSDNASLSEIFTRLSQDEKAHEAQFAQILNTISDENPKEGSNDDMHILQATSASEFFKTDFLSNAGQLSTQDVLIKALNFEKSTLLHYHALADVIQDSEKIKGLIAAEKEHVAVLMKVILNDAQFRGLADTF